jgi:hypothetical protein
VKQDEAGGPPEVGLLGTDGIVLEADGIACLIEASFGSVVPYFTPEVLDLPDFVLYTIHQARDMRTSVNFSRLHPQDKFCANPQMGRLDRQNSAEAPNVGRFRPLILQVPVIWHNYRRAAVTGNVEEAQTERDKSF